MCSGWSLCSWFFMVAACCWGFVWCVVAVFLGVDVSGLVSRFIYVIERVE